MGGTPVYVFNAGGSYLGLSGTTDAAGQVRLRLPAAGYRFRADYLGTQHFSAQVLLQAGQVNAVAISTGGGAVSLSVSNGSSGAVAGATCYLFNGGGTYLNMSRTTDAAGDAGFDLADGAYRIRVDFLGGSFWTEPFTVPGAMHLTLDLGGGSLRFTVDDGSLPIPGATTYLFDADGTYLNLSRVTDESGASIYTVPAGTYRLRSDYLGYQFWSETVIVAADAACALSIPHRQVGISVFGEYAGATEPRPNLPVHLFSSGGVYLGRTLWSDASGQVLFDLPERGYKVRADDLSFSYWSADLQGTGASVTIPEAIAQVVVTRAGQPLAGVPVYLLSTAGTYLNVGGTTAANGTASFRLPAQAFRLRADDSGLQFFSADVALAASQVTPVPISLGGGTLTLTVADGDGPLAGVSCYLFDDRSNFLGASRVSGSDGTVQFDLADGRYRVRADYLGYPFWTESIAVPNQMQRTLLIPRQQVAVTVLGAYGEDARAVVGAPVYLFADGGAYLGESRSTDAAGMALFTVPQQSYQARADYLGAAYWSAPFVWASPVVTIAEGLAQVTVTQAGAPLGGVLVYLFDERGSYQNIAQQADAAGRTSFRLPVGGYRFAADVQGIRYFGAASIAAGQISPVELSTGGALFGLSVDDGAGSALGAVPVSVFSASGTYLGIQQNTDAQGHVAFTLSDGAYLLRVDYRGYQFWTPGYTVPAQTSALLAIPHGLARIHVTAAGVDVTGAPVYVFDAAGTYLSLSESTDSSGFAQFRLPAKAYSFRADYNGGQHWGQAVNIAAGAVMTVGIDVGQ